MPRVTVTQIYTDLKVFSEGVHGNLQEQLCCGSIPPSSGVQETGQEDVTPRGGAFAKGALGMLTLCCQSWPRRAEQSWTLCRVQRDLFQHITVPKFMDHSSWLGKI